MEIEMTAQKAKKIIEIAIPNPVNKENYEALISSLRDGVTEFQIFEILLATGVNVDREEVFDALFLDSFKEFVASQAPTPTAL